MPVIATPLPQRVRNTDRFELNRNSWQAAGLVGWWPLGAYPDARDMGLYGYHGIPATTGYGGPEMPAASALGQRRALRFDGVDDYINIGEKDLYRSPSGTGFSIAAWLNPDGVGSDWDTWFAFRATSEGGTLSSTVTAYRHSNDLYVYCRNDGRTSNFSGYIATNCFVAGQWTHVVWGREADGTVYAYIDGVRSATTGTCTGNITDQVGFAVIGIDLTSTHGLGYPWGGLIDDYRLYNRALSANEVAAIYNQTRDGGYGDLAAQPTRFHHLPVADDAAIVPQAIHHYQMAGGL